MVTLFPISPTWCDSTTGLVVVSSTAGVGSLPLCSSVLTCGVNVVTPDASTVGSSRMIIGFTVTKNEILTAFNKPDEFILALVEVDGDATVTRYVRQPFHREPDFGVTSVNYNLVELLARSEQPR